MPLSVVSSLMKQFWLVFEARFSGHFFEALKKQEFESGASCS
jgi:hypothetical protein